MCEAACGGAGMQCPIIMTSNASEHSADNLPAQCIAFRQPTPLEVQNPPSLPDMHAAAAPLPRLVPTWAANASGSFAVAAADRQLRRSLPAVRPGPVSCNDS